jgi:CRP-like cAMP-binding protein
MEPSEPRRGWVTSKVEVSWAGSFAGKTVQIQLGLSRSTAQHRLDLGQLPSERVVRPALVGEGYAGLARERQAGHTGQVPEGNSRTPASEAQLPGDAPESARISEDESTSVVNFWNSLSENEKQAFRARAAKRIFATGARMMQEGEQANQVAVILDGWTEIRTRKNGKEQVVARRGPGQLIGERAALQISVRSATVVAISPVEALVMHTEDFAKFVSDHPGVLDLVENQIFSRLKERAARCEHDEPPGPATLPARSRAGAHGARRSRLNGENCTVMLTDVVAFGAEGRNDEDREIIRRATLSMTRLFLGAAWDVCRCEDRGDGHLIVLPPAIPTAQAMEQLLRVLPAKLRRHNRIYSESIRVQLRVAVDVGPVTEDMTGVSGNSIIRAARMLDSENFRRAIAGTGSVLGIIVSPFVYDTAIRHGRGSLDPAGYTEVPVQVKETNILAWMQLIGPVSGATSIP